MNRIFIKFLSLILMGVIYSTSLSAQPGPPDPPDNPVPITGVEYLIAAGAAFGAKKLYNKKKSV